MPLKDKVVCVVGGEGLIGSAICGAFEEAGAKVISADFSIKEVEINSSGISKMPIDVTSEDSIDSAIKAITDKLGVVDVLVNSSYIRAYDEPSNLFEVDASQWTDQVGQALKGAFTLSQKFGKSMADAKVEGSIVHIGSIYGSLGPDFSLYENTELTNPYSYGVVKSGLVGLVKYLAVFFSQYNVRVNLISPGGVANEQPKAFVEKYVKKVPLSRMATPHDVAHAVIYLASSSSSYTTGQNLFVDGGISII